MAAIKMTMDLAYAIAMDAAKAAMRKDGRKKQNDDDHEIYCATLEKCIGAPACHPDEFMAWLQAAPQSAIDGLIEAGVIR